MEEHGTPAGYQAHKRRGDQTCEACRRAHRQYMQAWRQENPDREAQQRAAGRLRNRALAILGQRHAAELAQIIQGLNGSGPRR